MTDRLDRQTDLGQQRRLILLLITCSALGFLLIGRLAWYQLIYRMETNPQRPETIPAVRGDIVDANGHYLVTSTYACSVFFRPDKYDDVQEQEKLLTRLVTTLEELETGPIPLGADKPENYVSALVPLLYDDASGDLAPLGRDLRQILIPDEDLFRALVILLSDSLNEPRSEIEKTLLGSRAQRHTLSAGVREEICQAIHGLGNEILVVDFDFQRVYPDGSLLAHVLGFVNFEQEPQYGLEWYYDGLLRGQSGEWRGISDPFGARLLAALGGYQAAQDGATLALTIDRNIQYQAERILREAQQISGASSGTLIVLDPRTGALLAMANNPTYHPGAFWEVDLATLRNNATSAVYEPGSVIKPLTLAAAIDARVIHPNATYDDRGVIVVGNEEVRNADRQAHGETTMTELLAYSLNVGAAHVASSLGPARFYEMFKRFGFSDPTGIDLAAEERGIMRVPGHDAWHMSDLGRNSYGQGMSATPLQVAVAYGALANQGVIRRPYIVTKVSHEDGTRQPAADWGRQVVSAEVAEQVTNMLVDAVKLGMQPALVPGYTIAGKSGTSQVVREGEYERGNYIGSFVGYGPVPDPHFVILVKLDGLEDGQWGVQVAGPAFAEMYKYLMDYYGILPNA